LLGKLGFAGKVDEQLKLLESVQVLWKEKITYKEKTAKV
jgi:hypothetical protein